MAYTMKCALLACVFLCLIVQTQSTLSKSGSKDKEEASSPKKSSPKIGKRQDEAKETDDLRSSILNKSNKLDSSKGKREFAKLGYVTPWNGHGYDIAKWTTQKYTHISPVWFQLVPTMIGDELSCSFTGQHDIDRGWLEDLRKNNSDVKIVPRFIFESQDSNLFQQFLTAESAQLKCASALTEFLLRNQFDGCVFEFWLQILIATRGEAVNFLIEMTELFGKRLHQKELLLIVPMTPPIQNMIPDGKSFLPEQVIPRLLEAVDYLNLMTYDFGGNDAEGVAPLPWIVGNVQLFLMSNPEHASKILIGLNYYGRCTGSISDSIMFNKFLELLADDSYELLWDDTTRESYIQSPSTKCFYPSLRSIEERLNLVEQEQLGGVGIWELGQGLNDFTTLL